MREVMLSLVLVFAVGCAGEQLVDSAAVDRERGEVAALFDVASAQSEEPELTYEERVARIAAEVEVERRERYGDRFDLQSKATKTTKTRPKKRRVKMEWVNPALLRGRLWNVPEQGGDTAAASALLRICISEAGGYENDCLGIWQVVRNVRSRGCDRDGITDCNEGGETHLSAMKRLSGAILGTVPPRTRRQRWIASLDLSCKQPPGFTGSTAQWERYYGRQCPRTAELTQNLVSGRLKKNLVSNAVPIAWGGRCEDRGGACDDPIACARGLARIPGLDTRNAFWCRPGSRGCASTVDPVCKNFAKKQQ